MPQFFATCPLGLSETLQQEIESFELGVKSFRSVQRGLFFECSWAKCYELNLRSRIASKFLKPVLDFSSPTEEQIPAHIKKHDFSKYLKPGGSFSLKVKIHKNSKFKNQPFLMNQIRVALLEEFEKKGRGDITASKEAADLEIVVQVYKAQFAISLNMSGQSLSNRSYRLEKQRAPIRENLAAGLLSLTEWETKTEPLLDFFCGSGTFLIEAALKDQPNNAKRSFAFQNWANFDEVAYKEILKKVNKVRRSPKEIFGFDQSPKSVEQLRALVSSLNLENSIHIKQQALKDLKSIKGPGVVLINPPYGERLGEKGELKSLYRLIGEKLKSEFSGWRAYIISSDADLVKELHMKSFFKKKVYNGGLECFFLGYHVD